MSPFASRTPAGSQSGTSTDDRDARFRAFSAAICACSTISGLATTLASPTGRAAFGAGVTLWVTGTDGALEPQGEGKRPRGHDHPVRRAWDTKEAVWLSGSEAALPLWARGYVVGVLSLDFTDAPADAPSRAWIESLATYCAVALDRALLVRDMHAARHSVEELSEQDRLHEQELKRLAMAERSAREQSVAATRSRDEFLATVSHELRTPLNAILGWVQLLRSGSLSEERSAHALRVVERNARVQEQLISDLLDVSRVITGRLRLNVVHVRLHEVVDMAVEVVRPAATDRGIELSVDLDGEAPEVMGDSDRLQQVIWNLLTNAIKFTPAGGRIEVILRTELPHVAIYVRDTGKGMAPQFLEYVFQPFRQADSSFARRQKGLGLGLAITRSLVEMHAGMVEAFSDGESRGSTFVVRLPVATLRPEATPRVPAFARTTPRPMRSPVDALRDRTVLVVEDEPDSRELLVSLLEQQGAKVLAAASVAEALEKLTLATPDVLLSDVGLPGEDGLSLIRRIRELPGGKSLPAIALTAFVSPADRRRAIEAGFDAHVAKPIEPDVLVRVLLDLVERGRPGAHAREA